MSDVKPREAGMVFGNVGVAPATILTMGDPQQRHNRLSVNPSAFESTLNSLGHDDNPLPMRRRSLYSN